VNLLGGLTAALTVSARVHFRTGQEAELTGTGGDHAIGWTGSVL